MGIKEKSKELWEKLSLEVTKEKLKSIIEKSKDILNLSSSAHLSKFLDQIQLMVNMIGDYINGNYKDIPWKTIASIAGALIYIILPIDAIPDVMPLVGLLDDAFIIGLCIKCFSTDLEQYKINMEDAAEAFKICKDLPEAIGTNAITKTNSPIPPTQ